MAIRPTHQMSSTHISAVKTDTHHKSLAPDAEKFQSAILSYRIHEEKSGVSRNDNARVVAPEGRTSAPPEPYYSTPTVNHDAPAVDLGTQDPVDTDPIIQDMKSEKTLEEVANDHGLTITELIAALKDAGYEVEASFEDGQWDVSVYDGETGYLVVTYGHTEAYSFVSFWVDGAHTTFIQYSNGKIVKKVLSENGVTTTTVVMPDNIEEIFEDIVDGKTLEEIASDQGITLDELIGQLEEAGYRVEEDQSGNSTHVRIFDSHSDDFVAEYYNDLTVGVSEEAWVTDKVSYVDENGNTITRTTFSDGRITETFQDEYGNIIEKESYPSGDGPPVTYVVQEGDNLTLIAQKYGISLEELKEDNPEFFNSPRDPDLIFAGEELVISGGDTETIKITTADGKTVTMAPDGAITSKNADGEVVDVDPSSVMGVFPKVFSSIDLATTEPEAAIIRSILANVFAAFMSGDQYQDALSAVSTAAQHKDAMVAEHGTGENAEGTTEIIDGLSIVDPLGERPPGSKIPVNVEGGWKWVDQEVYDAIAAEDLAYANAILAEAIYGKSLAQLDVWVNDPDFAGALGAAKELLDNVLSPYGTEWSWATASGDPQAALRRLDDVSVQVETARASVEAYEEARNLADRLPDIEAPCFSPVGCGQKPGDFERSKGTDHQFKELIWSIEQYRGLGALKLARYNESQLEDPFTTSIDSGVQPDPGEEWFEIKVDDIVLRVTQKGKEIWEETQDIAALMESDQPAGIKLNKESGSSGWKWVDAQTAFIWVQLQQARRVTGTYVSLYKNSQLYTQYHSLMAQSHYYEAELIDFFVEKRSPHLMNLPDSGVADFRSVYFDNSPLHDPYSEINEPLYRLWPEINQVLYNKNVNAQSIYKSIEAISNNSADMYSREVDRLEAQIGELQSELDTWLAEHIDEKHVSANDDCAMPAHDGSYQDLTIEEFGGVTIKVSSEVAESYGKIGLNAFIGSGEPVGILVDANDDSEGFHWVTSDEALSWLSLKAAEFRLESIGQTIDYLNSNAVRAGFMIEKPISLSDIRRDVEGYISTDIEPMLEELFKNELYDGSFRKLNDEDIAGILGLDLETEKGADALEAVREEIESIGGRDATVSVVPIVYVESKRVLSAIFAVKDADGQLQYVDATGKKFDNVADFRESNDQFSDNGLLIVPEDFQMRRGTDGTFDLDVGAGRILSDLETTVDPVVGIVTTAATVGLMIPGVNVVAAPIAAAGGLYLGARAIGNQIDHISHGGEWDDERSRMNLLSVATTALPMAASGLRMASLLRTPTLSKSKSFLASIGGLHPYRTDGLLANSAMALPTSGNKLAWWMDAAAMGTGIPLTAVSAHDFIANGDQMSGLHWTDAFLGLATGLVGTGLGIHGLRTMRPGAGNQQIGEKGTSPLSSAPKGAVTGGEAVASAPLTGLRAADLNLLGVDHIRVDGEVVPDAKVKLAVSPDAFVVLVANDQARPDPAELADRIAASNRYNERQQVILVMCEGSLARPEVRSQMQNGVAHSFYDFSSYARELAGLLGARVEAVDGGLVLGQQNKLEGNPVTARPDLPVIGTREVGSPRPHLESSEIVHAQQRYWSHGSNIQPPVTDPFGPAFIENGTVVEMKGVNHPIDDLHLGEPTPKSIKGRDEVGTDGDRQERLEAREQNLAELLAQHALEVGKRIQIGDVRLLTDLSPQMFLVEIGIDGIWKHSNPRRNTLVIDVVHSTGSIGSAAQKIASVAGINVIIPVPRPDDGWEIFYPRGLSKRWVRADFDRKSGQLILTDRNGVSMPALAEDHLGVQQGNGVFNFVFELADKSLMMSPFNSSQDDATRLLALTDRIREMGAPHVAEIYGVLDVHGRRSILMDSYASNKKSIITQYQNGNLAGGYSFFKRFFSKESMSSLQATRDWMLDNKISIDNLQFLIAKDGTFRLANMKGVSVGKATMDNEIQLIDDLVRLVGSTLEHRTVQRARLPTSVDLSNPDLDLSALRHRLRSTELAANITNPDREITTVFRGDSRAPQEIFETGFSALSHGKKVSTSLSAHNATGFALGEDEDGRLNRTGGWLYTIVAEVSDGEIGDSLPVGRFMDRDTLEIPFDVEIPPENILAAREVTPGGVLNGSTIYNERFDPDFLIGDEEISIHGRKSINTSPGGRASEPGPVSDTLPTSLSAAYFPKDRLDSQIPSMTDLMRDYVPLYRSGNEVSVLAWTRNDLPNRQHSRASSGPSRTQLRATSPGNIDIQQLEPHHVPWLKPDQVAGFTSKQWADFKRAGLQPYLTRSQLRAIPENNVRYIDAGTLTQKQVEDLRASQTAAFTIKQWVAFNRAGLHAHLNKTQLASIPTNRFKLIDVGGLTEKQVPWLSAKAQLPNMTDIQWKAFNQAGLPAYLTRSQFRSVPESRIREINVPALRPDQIPWFTNKQWYAFNRAGLQKSLNEAQTRAIPLNRMGSLDVTRLEPKHMGWLSGDQLGALPTGQVQKLSGDQIRAVPNDLVGEIAPKLKDEQFYELSLAQVEGITDAQKARMGEDKSLLLDELVAVRKLTIDNIANMSAFDWRNFTRLQWRALTGDQLRAIPERRVKLIDLNSLRPSQLPEFTTAQVRKFTPSQMGRLNKEYLAAFTSAHNAAFRPVQTALINPDRRASFDGFKPASPLTRAVANMRGIEGLGDFTVTSAVSGAMIAVWPVLPPTVQAGLAIGSYLTRGLTQMLIVVPKPWMAASHPVGRTVRTATAATFVVSQASSFWGFGAAPFSSGPFMIGNGLYQAKNFREARTGMPAFQWADKYGLAAYGVGSPVGIGEIMIGEASPYSPLSIAVNSSFTFGSGWLWFKQNPGVKWGTHTDPKLKNGWGADMTTADRWIYAITFGGGLVTLGGIAVAKVLSEDSQEQDEPIAGTNEPEKPEQQPEKPEPTPERSPQLVVTAPDGLNVRETAGMDGEKLGTFYSGSLVDDSGERTIDDDGHEWALVEGFGITGRKLSGWVRTDFVDTHEAGDQDSQGRFNPDLESKGYEWVYVEPGQNIGSIARDHGVDVADTVILNLDHIIDPAIVFSGDRIYLPVTTAT